MGGPAGAGFAGRDDGMSLSKPSGLSHWPRSDRETTAVNHFLQELDQLTTELLELAAMVEASVRDSLRALDERRPDLARRVIDADAAIDRKEVRIEEECIRHLVLAMPVAGDLRRVIAVLKIDNDLERIADLAVNIAEEALAAGPEDLPIPGTLRAMADRALQMVRARSHSVARAA